MTPPVNIPALRVVGVTKRFHGVTALADLDLSVARGELLGVIGPNGSGKTTLFDCVAGVLRPEEGKVFLAGEEITGLPTHVLARRGVGRTFQAARFFPRLTARQHLLAALQEFQRDGFASRLLRLRAARAAEASGGRRADELLAWVGLDDVAAQPAGALSYGQRKLLAFAMALAPEPLVLLLDEPMAGVNPVLVERLTEHIRMLHAEGRTIVVIEHNLGVVMRLCERLVVLDHGQKIAEGLPAEVRAAPAVIEAYFGS